MRRAISKIRSFVTWVRRLPKKIIIPAVLLLLVLVSFGTYKAISAYSYMEDDPNFCRACHTMEKAWDRWQTSEHRSVGCHSCHESDVIDDAMLLIKFSLSSPDDVGKHARVKDESCEKCHESGNPRWVQVAATAGHVVHAEQENIACVKCHGVTVHRFTPPGTICVLCHEDKPIAVSGMAEMHCTTCHEYLAEEVQQVVPDPDREEHPLLPTRKGCLECHQAMTGQVVTWPKNAPMQFTCWQCHQPHVQAKPTVDCLSCHAEAPTQGLHAVTVHAAVTCQTCHQPHEWKMETRSTCVTCHVDRVEHNVGTACALCHSFTGTAYTPAPLDIAPTPPSGGTAQPAGPPPIPHSLEGRSECTLCHGAGGFRPFPADHAGRTSETCLACHKQ
ncbi:MAG: hypothetical protein HW388_709 [Dehalococcoidia bacterium]|nr:hypothetical protein [Dehalococcoidia bacterium]